MDLKDIKKGLFGFNKDSVFEYIAELNRICAEKTEEAHREKTSSLAALNKTNSELNNKISALEVEIDALKKQILEKDSKIEALENDNEVLKNDTDTKKAVEAEVAEILTEARRFAQSIREKTTAENEALRLENRKAYSAEKERIALYGRDIAAVKDVIDTVLKDTLGGLKDAEEKLSALERVSGDENE